MCEDTVLYCVISQMFHRILMILTENQIDSWRNFIALTRDQFIPFCFKHVVYSNLLLILYIMVSLVTSMWVLSLGPLRSQDVFQDHIIHTEICFALLV